MDYGDLTIIIPTLNEGGNIGRLVRILAARYGRVHIIVADDGSRDRTREEVAKCMGTADVLFLDRRRAAVHGLTASVVDAALRARTDYIIVMDADFQHPPEVVGELYRKLLGGADLAIAVRTKVMGWSAYRRFMSRGIIVFSTIVFKLRRRPVVSDMMSGFFGIRTKLFKRLIKSRRDGFVMPGYKVLLDILRMDGSGIRMSEVPYSTFHARKYGKSKLRPARIADALRSVLR